MSTDPGRRGGGGRGRHDQDDPRKAPVDLLRIAELTKLQARWMVAIQADHIAALTRHLARHGCTCAAVGSVEKDAGTGALATPGPCCTTTTPIAPEGGGLVPTMLRVPRDRHRRDQSVTIPDGAR